MGLHQGRKDEKARKGGLGGQFTLLAAVFFEIQQARQQNDRQNDDKRIQHGFSKVCFESILNGSIYNLKDCTILSPSLDPSLQGREGNLLLLDGGGRVG